MRTTRDHQLTALAAELGVTITEHTGGPKGLYHHESRTISIRDDLGHVRHRCTLAHELGHAIRGDTLTGVEWADARAERAADQIAAQLLISPTEYAAAEAIYGPHPAAIAQELAVTRHLLDVWREYTRRQSRIASR